MTGIVCLLCLLNKENVRPHLKFLNAICQNAQIMMLNANNSGQASLVLDYFFGESWTLASTALSAFTMPLTVLSEIFNYQNLPRHFLHCRDARRRADVLEHVVSDVFDSLKS
jgi:hypothetical protein